MAIQTLTTVEANTAPPFQITCERNGVVIDLTTALSVSLVIALKRQQTNSSHAVCTITNAAQGIITYSPVSGDFPSAGNYFCDVNISWGNGSSETLEDVLLITARPHVNSTS